MLEKYFSIALYSFKKAKYYPFNNIMSIISSLIFISISYFLWIAINGTHDAEAMQQSINYIILINIIYQVLTINTESIIGSKVISGDIIIDLSKPIPFFSYILFDRIGLVIFNLIFLSVPLIVCSVIFFNFSLNFNHLLYFVLSLILSFFMIFIFEFILGMISFWTSQIFGISLIKSSLVNILAGITLPLMIYPEFLQNIFINLPFQSMYMAPVMIAVDGTYPQSIIQELFSEFSFISSQLSILLEQLFWILILLLICKLVWKRAINKLVIQGG